MTALLELPTARQRVQGLSVEGYHRLGESGMLSENVELLRGIVFAKMPKSPLHEFVSQKLMRILLAKVPSGFEVRPERPLTLKDSEPEPDISVVRGKPEDWAKEHPSSAHLVVEVAVSSAELDEGKAEIYAEAGILEYWLVRPDKRTVDVYRDPKGSVYLSRLTLNEKQVLQCASIPGIEFTLKEILPQHS